MTTGVASQFWTDLQKPGASHLNMGARWTSKSLQNLLGEIFFDDTGGISTTLRIAAGLKWSLPGGANQVDTTAGVAAFKHAGGLTDVLNSVETVPDTIFAQLDAANHTFADNLSGNPRIDLIVLTWVVDTDTNVAVPQKAGAPVGQDLRWNVTASFSVLQGTPAASPVAPTPSATQMPVYQVDIPDGTTSANFATAVTVRELAPTATIGRLGAGHGALKVDAYSTTLSRRVLECQQQGGGVHALRFQFQDSPADPSRDWYPCFERPVGMPVGEENNFLYPMVIPGGREWTMFLPFSSGQLFDIVGSTGIFVIDDGLEAGIYRSGVAAQSFGFAHAIPLPARGLQLVSCVFHWNVVVAFDGTINTDTLSFGTADELAAFTELSGLPSMGLGTTGVKSSSFTPTGSPVVIDKERLRISATFGLAADGTAVGQVRLRGMELTLREGRV